MTEEKKIKVEILPGAFDEFNGTQEDLDEIIREIERMANDGSLFENSVPISFDDPKTVAEVVGTTMENLTDRINEVMSESEPTPTKPTNPKRTLN